MAATTSQLPTQGGWLDHLLSRARTGEVVVYVRWSNAVLRTVLRALSTWNRGSSLSALEAHWSEGLGCYSLLLLMEARSVSPSMTVMTGSEATARMRTSLLRHLSRYAAVQEVTVYQVGQPPLDELREALSSL